LIRIGFGIQATWVNTPYEGVTWIGGQWYAKEEVSALEEGIGVIKAITTITIIVIITAAIMVGITNNDINGVWQLIYLFYLIVSLASLSLLAQGNVSKGKIYTDSEHEEKSETSQISTINESNKIAEEINRDDSRHSDQVIKGSVEHSTSVINYEKEGLNRK
jgi:hypothetical protein